MNCKESFAVYEGDLVSLLNIYRQYEVYRPGAEATKTAWPEETKTRTGPSGIS